MPQLLKLHPDSRSFAVRHIEVEIARPRPDGLLLSYIVTGTMSDILMPPALAATRSDDLWQHTCFEAFVRASPNAEYYEFNFAPSTQWAAYRFSGYRSGKRVVDEIDAPRIDVQSETGSCTLRASLNLGGLPALAHKASWQVGLSAVIEDMTGGMSYWALAHPPGKPDFHHADSFAHEFAPVVSS
jgi:hypothetical protein